MAISVYLIRAPAGVALWSQVDNGRTFKPWGCFSVVVIFYVEAVSELLVSSWIPIASLGGPQLDAAVFACESQVAKWRTLITWGCFGQGLEKFIHPLESWTWGTLMDT